MAGTTPIYGFPYPESSDLVADYPALGQDLAEDVEAAIAAVPPGGLVHIATESFSAVSSVSLNGVFSATYNNYHFILDIVYASGGDPSFRYRAGGTDETSSTYTRQFSRTQNTTFAGALGTSTSNFLSFMTGDNQNFAGTFYNPFLAVPTRHLILGGTESAVGMTTGRNSLSTSFDGLTIATSVGNFTGTIRVYGYQNS